LGWAGVKRSQTRSKKKKKSKSREGLSKHKAPKENRVNHRANDAQRIKKEEKKGGEKKRGLDVGPNGQIRYRTTSKGKGRA